MVIKIYSLTCLFLTHTITLNRRVLYMTQPMDQLEALQEIRHIMDRTSRFTSLSGRAGIFAGVSALIGSAALLWHFRQHRLSYAQFIQGETSSETLVFLALLMTGVFVCAAGATFYFTLRRARWTRQPIWRRQGHRFFLNLAIPLAVGGAFCGALVYHGLFSLLAPASLLFYGLALIHGSKYTFRGLRYLGWGEVLLGAYSCFVVEQGLWCWALGFGVLHVLYGGALFYTMERAQPSC